MVKIPSLDVFTGQAILKQEPKHPRPTENNSSFYKALPDNAAELRELLHTPSGRSFTPYQWEVIKTKFNDLKSKSLKTMQHQEKHKEYTEQIAEFEANKKVPPRDLIIRWFNTFWPEEGLLYKDNGKT